MSKIPSIQEILSNEKYRLVTLIVCLSIGLFRLLIGLTSSKEFAANQLADLQLLKEKIAIFRPSKTFTSRDELEDIRAFSLHDAGIANYDYQLSPNVFDELDPECHWPNELGYEPNDIVLYNPLVLIYPQFLNVLAFQAAVPGEMVSSQVSQDSLVFLPEEGRIEFTVRADNSKLEVFGESALQFRAVSFNATDLGYMSIQFDAEGSKNLESVDKQPVLPNISSLSCVNKGSTEEVKGINQVVLSNAISPLRILKLPATAVFNLWKELPNSSENSPSKPDVIFSIKFT